MQSTNKTASDIVGMPFVSSLNLLPSTTGLTNIEGQMMSLINMVSQAANILDLNNDNSFIVGSNSPTFSNPFVMGNQPLMPNSVVGDSLGSNAETFENMLIQIVQTATRFIARMDGNNLMNSNVDQINPIVGDTPLKYDIDSVEQIIQMFIRTAFTVTDQLSEWEKINGKISLPNVNTIDGNNNHFGFGRPYDNSFFATSDGIRGRIQSFSDQVSNNFQNIRSALSENNPETIRPQLFALDSGMNNIMDSLSSVANIIQSNENQIKPFGINQPFSVNGPNIFNPQVGDGLNFDYSSLENILKMIVDSSTRFISEIDKPGYNNDYLLRTRNPDFDSKLSNTFTNLASTAKDLASNLADDGSLFEPSMNIKSPGDSIIGETGDTKYDLESVENILKRVIDVSHQVATSLSEWENTNGLLGLQYPVTKHGLDNDFVGVQRPILTSTELYDSANDLNKTAHENIANAKMILNQNPSEEYVRQSIVPNFQSLASNIENLTKSVVQAYSVIKKGDDLLASKNAVPITNLNDADIVTSVHRDSNEKFETNKFDNPNLKENLILSIAHNAVKTIIDVRNLQSKLVETYYTKQKDVNPGKCIFVIISVSV